MDDPFDLDREELKKWYTSATEILPDCARLSKISEEAVRGLFHWYVPLAGNILKRQRLLGRTLIIGINGAQGSGKTTTCLLLRSILSKVMKLSTVCISLDDFYFTRRQREKLASEIHPLLRTRGVPGTHDIALGLHTLNALQYSPPKLPLPQFCKAVDDRLSSDKWPIWSGRCDIVLFEGWCVGAHPQPEKELLPPVNILESDEDPDGKWRRFVNYHLGTDYQLLFSLIDYLIMLKIPNMDCVFRWRGQQENRLAEQLKVEPYLGSAVMSPVELNRFIQHYERLTLFMLCEMPTRVDVVYELDVGHTIVSARYHNPN